MRQQSRTQADEEKQKSGVQEIRDPAGASAAPIGEASRWNTHAHRRAENSGTEIRDPVRTELGVGIGALQVNTGGDGEVQNARPESHLRGQRHRLRALWI